MNRAASSPYTDSLESGADFQIQWLVTYAIDYQYRSLLIYNDSLKEGKVVVREIYALNKASYSMLPVKMNKYKYDLNGELAEKVTYKWNPAKVKWIEESKMNISHHTDETVVEYGEWISSKKGFLPSQKYVYVTNNDTNLVTQYCYKMNKHTSQWELQKKAVVSKIEDIFAQRN
ncbi:DUF3836 domain-containing protein [Bacteroides graminisolvens]|uniref:DUF3836 domain-containing protein n=1 Tax=Bacteroides graminisolvens TaxID=477666 RepID=UPI0023F55C9D|nr:DUF3836 domain-containing protein [Bacteroides graminisolvens]MDD3210860.1 DUF3836 domain-containing protein [Bacteroides graminisolvens]